MKNSPARFRHRTTVSAVAAGVVGCLFLLGAANALAASPVYSGIGTAITTGSSSRSEHTISTAATRGATDPIGDRVGSRVTR
jgi:membrane associated rhomboid family serine protease